MRIFAICLLVFLMNLMCLGCTELAEWRNQQIKTSHELGEGSKIVVPDPPIQIPKHLYSTLPLGDGFTILAYSENKSTGQVEIDALVNQELEGLSVWMINRLADLGYGSDDNSSRILEGTTYSRTKNDTRFSTIIVKVEGTDSNGSLIHLRATRDR